MGAEFIPAGLCFFLYPQCFKNSKVQYTLGKERGVPGTSMCSLKGNGSSPPHCFVYPTDFLLQNSCKELGKSHAENQNEGPD